MRFRKTLLCAAATVGLVIPAHAGLFTWDFTGTWLSTNYGPHGTTLAGSVTFDTDTTTATAFTFTVSGYPEGAVTYTMSPPAFVDVQNDQGYDLIGFRGDITMSGPSSLTGSLPWQTASFALFDTSQTMLSSTTIPNSPPSLSGLAGKTINLIYGQSTFSDAYTLTSLAAVPEPATAALLALGLAGAAFIRRRK